ncbi:MAG TPA: PKD domain-containing protein [Planctomycetota bacterium]
MSVYARILSASGRAARVRFVLLAITGCGLLLGSSARAESLTITTLVRPSEPGAGCRDGPALSARFFCPWGIAVDSAGNAYISDRNNCTIRKMSPGGMVTTLAGRVGEDFAFDGQGSAAEFSYAYHLAVDSAGNVYVADSSHNMIRKINPFGVVGTLAGTEDSGSDDGIGSAAQFNGPTGIAVDQAGNVYVSDTQSCTIRKITPMGTVSTIAGVAGQSGSVDGPGIEARFSYPKGLACDSSGNLYVADSVNYTIRKITPDGLVTTFAGSAGNTGIDDGTGDAARFEQPTGLAVDSAGTVYVADYSRVRKITPGGQVTTLAGQWNAGSASNDICIIEGTGSAARFRQVADIAVAGGGYLYVTDCSANCVFKVTSGGMATIIAGADDGAGGSDGTGNAAHFYYPTGVVADAVGNVYTTELNCTVRKITPDGVITTVAGLAGLDGSADGTGADARFAGPTGLALDSSGNIYVADQNNHTIRKVTPAGVVTTFAGQAGVRGHADGNASEAQFNYPTGIAIDRDENIYIAEASGNTIRMITPAGVVSTIAGSPGVRGSEDGPGTDARFFSPQSVAVDSSGNLYVADTMNATLRLITPDHVVSTLAGIPQVYGAIDGTGAAARFVEPSCVSIDAAGNLFVGDYSLIRKVTPAGAVSTVAGNLDYNGDADGTGSQATFGRISGVGTGPANSVFIADRDAHLIRKGVPALGDVATIDKTSAIVGTARQLGTSPQTATSWEWTLIHKPSWSNADFSSTTVANPTFTPDAADLYVFRLVATDASGAQSISTVQFTGTPGPPSTFSILDIPSAIPAGVTANSTVLAMDAYHNLATGYLGAVHFTSSDGAADLPTDYTFIAGDAGKHLFAVTLKTAGVHAVTVMDKFNGSINGTRGNITVSAAGASRLRVSGFASPVISGTASSLTVSGTDAYGNAVATYTGTIHFSSTDANAVLPSDYTFVSGDQGTRNFTATLKTAGAQNITATDTVVGSILGVQISIDVQASGFQVSGFASPGTAGNPGSFTVTAKDAVGNTATNYRGTVHFTSSDPAAVLPGEYTFTSSDNGVKTLSATLKTAGAQSITATDKNNSNINGSQAGIQVNAGPASKLAFTTHPGNGNGGAYLPVQPVVTVQDAYGNTAVSDGSDVTLAIQNNPGNATLGGTVKVAAANGVASFSGLSIDKVGTGYTLQATDGSLTGAISMPFNINYGAATKLAFTAQPTDCVAGTAFSTQIGVTVLDANGNVVGNDSSNVTLAIYTNPGSGTLGGTNTTSAVNGVAAFSGLSIDKSGNGYTLIASDGNLTTAISSSFKVAAGTVSAVGVSGFPSSSTAGAPGSFTVTARDANGNIAAGYTGAIRFASSDGAAALPDDYTFVSADAGTKTFGAILKTAGSQSITATDKAMPSINGRQSNITINPGPATTLAVTGFPSPTQSGTAWSVTVRAKDSCGNTAAGYTGKVHFTSSDAGAALPGDYSFVSGDAGAKTFPATLNTPGTQSITVTDAVSASINGSQSGITINPLPPAITSAASASGSIGASFNYQITATNSPTGFDATSLPAGLQIDRGTGQLSGKPTEAVTKLQVTISASNVSGSGSATLELTITGTAPSINSALAASGQAGQAFSYTIAASGDGTLSFSASGLPSWLGLSGTTLSGTPSASGKFNVQLTATSASGSDTKTLKISVAPANYTPPSVTSISISRNPARTNTDVSFSAEGVAVSGLPLSFTWHFILDNVENGAPITGKEVTRAFAAEGSYLVQVFASDGYGTSQPGTATLVTLAPRSGGQGINLAQTQAAAVDPLNGLSLQVTGSFGGAIDFNVLASDAGETYETDFSNGRDPVSGTALATEFDRAKVYVATTTASQGGIVTRVARTMIPVSGSEVGTLPDITAQPQSHAFESMKLSGKCLFGKKDDTLTFQGTVELSAGIDLSQSTDLSIGVGNIVGDARISAKGKQLTKEQAVLKKIQVKYPKPAKGSTRTAAGSKAAITVTFGGSRLDQLGLESEGITNSLSYKPKQKYPLTVHLAMVLGGVVYQGTVNVDYSYSDASGGMFVTKK